MICCVVYLLLIFKMFHGLMNNPVYECISVDHWWSVLRGENHSTQTKTCPSVTLFTTGPTLTGLGSSPGSFGKRPATNCLSFIICVVEKVYVYKFVNIRRIGMLNHWIKLVFLNNAKSKYATLLSWHKDEILKHRR
jgi:hypothetical protein